MRADPFIAVDWGTTNRRAYLIIDGRGVRTERDAMGVLAVPSGGFQVEVDGLRARLGNHPVLLAGMVGSNKGWMDAGYVACPARFETLAGGVVQAAQDVWIVPGVNIVTDSRADVMRGEEVQLLGAVAAGLAPPDALLCQPGTHCKWAQIGNDALLDFSTGMTGEMFALLRDHALIGAAMAAPVTAGPAFMDGVARSGENDLLRALFGVRPASLLGLREDADAASYVSGLLIGSDVRAQVGNGKRVHILADPLLGSLYAAAIAMVGGEGVIVDSHDAFVAGIARIWDLVQ